MDVSISSAMFSEPVLRSLLKRFPSGTLDLFQDGDFCFDCTCITLLEQIAKGSYGTIYKGCMDGAIYAIKTENFQDNEEEKTNVIVELSMLTSFPHPNIVKLVGAGYLPHSVTGENTVMIVMELCKFGALRECLKYKLPWNLLVRICLDVATGLALLHQHEIIHRDVKTTNILIDENWRAKVCDFSFACHNSSTSKLDFVYGTEEFMSPEIALASDFDMSADIFSFGIVICELITGKDPSVNFLNRRPNNFFAVDEDELRGAVLVGCPEALEALALSCCNVKPNLRPDAESCIVELENMLSELGGKEFDFSPSSVAIAECTSVTGIQNVFSSPDREGRVQSPRREPSEISPLMRQTSSSFDPNVRLSYLEVQLQQVKAENCRLNRTLTSLISLLGSNEALVSSISSPFFSARLSSSTGETPIRDLQSGEAHNADSVGGSAKSRRILRRLSTIVPSNQRNDSSFDTSESVSLVHDIAARNISDDAPLPQHSRQDYLDTLEEKVRPLRNRIEELESKLASYLEPIERIVSNQLLTPQKPDPVVEFIAEERDVERSATESPFEMRDRIQLDQLLERLTNCEAEIETIKEVLSSRPTQQSVERNRETENYNQVNEIENGDEIVEELNQLHQRQIIAGEAGVSSQLNVEPLADEPKRYLYVSKRDSYAPYPNQIAGYEMNSSVNTSLTRALGSFLDVVHKCSGANELTKDLLTTLDQNVASPDSRRPYASTRIAEDVSVTDSFFDSGVRSSSKQAGSRSKVSSHGVSSPPHQPEPNLSNRRSPKTFSFAHTPTLRGPLDTQPKSGGFKSPPNETWREVYTPKSDHSSRLAFVDGNSSSPPSALPLRSNRQRNDIQQFFQTDPLHAKMNDPTSARTRYESPTNRSTISIALDYCAQPPRSEGSAAKPLGVKLNASSKKN